MKFKAHNRHGCHSGGGGVGGVPPGKISGLKHSEI